MTIMTVANALISGCREGRESENLDTLYAPDAVSVEAVDMGQGRETVGIEAIKGKHAWWDETFEVHDASIDGPFPHGEDRFAAVFQIDATQKDTGERTQMKEIAVYHVADGKITREEFFYPTGA